MSVSSSSRAALFLGSLLGLALLSAPAWAGDDPSSSDDQGQKVKRVSIGSDGIVVERENGTDTLISRDRRYRMRSRAYRHGWVHVDQHGDAIVRVFADAEVPAGKRVTGDVVAVCGSVTVAGHVEGDVVAVLGSVHLEPGAVVDGDCVSVGGTLEQGDDVEVGGETVSVGFMPGGSWGVPAVSLSLSAVITCALAALFLGWLFAFLFPVRLVRVAAVASRRTAASLLLGIASVPIFISALFLLFVTIVGIPLAILLPPSYALLCFAGQMAATYVLGCKVTAHRPGVGGLMVPIVAGTLLVAAFFVVGALLFVVPGVARPMALFSVLLGGLLVMGLTAIGAGAMLLSKLGAEPRDVTWTPASANPAPAPGLAPPSAVS